MVLIDSGSTHNFIHHKVAEDANFFVRPISNFQILIANGGTMKCGGVVRMSKLQMGDYNLKTHMFSISMGGCDIVLGVKWIHTLGLITMDYHELYMRFTQDDHIYTLKGLQDGSSKIISSHQMEKLLNKFHHDVIIQISSIQVHDQSSPTIHHDQQVVLDKHHKVFETHTCIPPSQGMNDHNIPLHPGNYPPNVHPYSYPYAKKYEK
jgi:hypothetical protein